MRKDLFLCFSLTIIPQIYKFALQFTEELNILNNENIQLDLIKYYCKGYELMRD